MKNSDFDSLYGEYVDLVHYTAYSMAKDYHLAQDICQEVFEKVFRAIRGLNTRNVKGWILVVTRLTAIDFLRKRSRRKEEFFGDAAYGLEPVSPVDIEMEYQRKEFKDELFLALYNKNEMWCEIILQLDVEGVAPAELAQRLGISLNHLRVKHHRAKSWLRSRFGKELEELF